MVRTILRSVVRQLGFDIIRYWPERSDAARIVQILKAHTIDFVIDVGANEGQYGTLLRRAGYTARILSFEPLSAPHAKLQMSSRGDHGWIVAPRMALGDEDGEVDVYVAGNSASSSTLPMLETHLAAAPTSRCVGTERSRIARLDAVESEYVPSDANIFLKIDVQGTEDRVLRGAAELLGRVKCVQVELSFVPLYEKQRMAGEMIQLLGDAGFELSSLLGGFFEPGTGRQLQVDGVFFRKQ